MKRKNKLIVKDIFIMMRELFANVILWLLIWTGAVMGLINVGEKFLAILLILSGGAKVWQERNKSLMKIIKWKNKKKNH